MRVIDLYVCFAGRIHGTMLQTDGWFSSVYSSSRKWSRWALHINLLLPSCLGELRERRFFDCHNFMKQRMLWSVLQATWTILIWIFARRIQYITCRKRLNYVLFNRFSTNLPFFHPLVSLCEFDTSGYQRLSVYSIHRSRITFFRIHWLIFLWFILSLVFRSFDDWILP